MHSPSPPTPTASRPRRSAARSSEVDVKFAMKPLVTMVLTAAALAAAPSAAFALGDGELSLGIRSADFEAAPATQQLAMSELAVSVHSDPLFKLPVTVGLTAAYDDMRGSLGSALSDFSGYDFGPEVAVRQTFG